MGTLTDPHKALAQAMAYNHVYRAGPPDLTEPVARRALIEPRGVPSAKIIVVVGAGASNAAAKLPTGKEAADELKAAMSVHIRDLVEAEIERLKLQYNMAEADFETILRALSQFDQPDVLKRLRAIFGRRHHPWLGYELLSHFMKHRFVDAVINFNFDEILDQAIADEMGDGAYYKVVLDGDCPADIGNWKDRNDKETNKFKLPLYLKLHGTASQPSSLRFTRDSYASITAGFESIIDDLFDPEHPVHVIVLGHAMQSVEFNHLIRRASHDRGKPMKFYFATAKPKKEPPIDFAAGLDVESCELHYSNCYEAGDSGVANLADYLMDLWRECVARYEAPYQPRPVGRHALVSKLFENRKIKDWPKSGQKSEIRKSERRRAAYFRERTLVELALALAKTKGFATMEDLANGRTGAYFRRYRDMLAGMEMVPADERDEKLKSLGHACDKLGLHVEGYGGSHVRLLPQTSDSRKVVVPEDLFEREAHGLAERTLQQIKSLKDASSHHAFMHQTLMEMYKGPEVEVAPGASHDRGVTFVNATVLGSYEALRWRTEQLIAKFDWNTIACTAKSGQWLVQRPEFASGLRRRKATLAIVVSDETYKGPLEDRFGDTIYSGVRWLPWWAHNRTATVFLQDDKPVYALVFERRLRTATIIPYSLEEPSDVKLVWDAFAAYWLKAGKLASAQASEKGRTLDQELEPSDLAACKQELIEGFKRHKNATPGQETAPPSPPRPKRRTNGRRAPSLRAPRGS